MYLNKYTLFRFNYTKLDLDTSFYRHKYEKLNYGENELAPKNVDFTWRLGIATKSVDLTWHLGIATKSVDLTWHSHKKC